MGRGRAEADLATDWERAECEKTALPGCRKRTWVRKQNVKFVGGKRMTGAYGSRGDSLWVVKTRMIGKHVSCLPNEAEHAIQISGLPRALEGGSIRQLVLFSHVNPCTNPKVTEGSLIGHKTGLSPLLSGLQEGDQDGMSIEQGVVGGGGEGVQRALHRSYDASGALAC